MLYLLGLTIHSSERLAIAFIPADGPVRVVLPALEQPRAESEARESVAWYPWQDAAGYESALRSCISDMSLGGRLGVEYTAMRLLELRAIEAVAQVETIDATDLLASLRMVKDAGELESMRAAVRVVEAGLKAAIDCIRPGVSEHEIADVWERAMREAGSEGLAFTTIVASGPNSANPHHTTGDRRVESGDLVILDGGARIGGYISDITRTVAVGAIDDELRRIYEIVRESNAAGVAAARPGASGATIDAAARGVIEDRGYGEYFIHRTGHSIDRSTHGSGPNIDNYETREMRLIIPGVGFSIEPGIYIPGEIGLRTEINVYVSESGPEVTTPQPQHEMTMLLPG
jgi:Xaa-Pro dipeptidase